MAVAAAVTGAAVGASGAVVAAGAAGEHAARSRQIERRRENLLFIVDSF
jgi:hypothetical protein